MMRMAVFGKVALAAGMALSSGAVLADVAMPLAELGAGMYRIQAEVAHTPQTRQLGLMNRKAMPVQHGMVFVFTRMRRTACG